MDEEIKKILPLFFKNLPHVVQSFDTSHGDADFRAACIVETDTGEKYVLKLAENDFTFPEKIAVWQRTAEEYRRLGYYCPKIIFRKRSPYGKEQPRSTAGSVITVRRLSGISPAPFPLSVSADTDVWPTQKNLRRFGRLNTDLRMTAIMMTRCMTAISRIYGG